MIPQSPEKAREGLKRIKDTSGLSWENIGLWFGIPGGSLSTFANGGSIKRAYLGRLGQLPLGKMSARDLRWSLENRYEIPG